METANQYATLRHDSWSVAREASAAPAASFKGLIGMWEFQGAAELRPIAPVGLGCGKIPSPGLP